MVDIPVDLIQLQEGDNHSFDNFFRNSFMHFYLRTPELQDLDNVMRLEIAKNKCDQIAKCSTFLVGMDKIDPNVFYSYVSYSLSENRLYLHMAYVKKKFRGFGFFKASLDLLKESANEYYYSLPIKLKKKSYLPEFSKRVL